MIKLSIAADTPEQLAAVLEQLSPRRDQHLVVAVDPATRAPDATWLGARVDQSIAEERKRAAQQARDDRMRAERDRTAEMFERVRADVEHLAAVTDTPLVHPEDPFGPWSWDHSETDSYGVPWASPDPAGDVPAPDLAVSVSPDETPPGSESLSVDSDRADSTTSDMDTETFRADVTPPPANTEVDTEPDTEVDNPGPDNAETAATTGDEADSELDTAAGADELAPHPRTTTRDRIQAGRIQRVDRGVYAALRYTAPTEPLRGDPERPGTADDAATDDDDDPEIRPLPGACVTILEFLLAQGGGWTIPGLLSEFPDQSEVSMKSTLRVLSDSDLVAAVDLEGGEPVFRALQAETR